MEPVDSPKRQCFQYSEESWFCAGKAVDRLIRVAYLLRQITTRIAAARHLSGARNDNELVSIRRSRKFSAPLRSDESVVLRFLYETVASS
jgi:hypothetical protein